MVPTGMCFLQMNNGPRIVISVELSNEMTEYLDAFTAAAAKFVLHDVPEGARIGVTSFGTENEGNEELGLTTISDADGSSSRQDIVDVIEGLSTPTTPGDCVGGGLNKSLEVGWDFGAN